VGLRYSAKLPAGDLQGLPSALRAAILNGRADFVTKPRGRVRDSNDRGHESRASHFAAWLARHGTGKQHLLAASDDDLLLILGHYAQASLRGDNLSGAKSNLGQTIRNYVTSATDWIRLAIGRPFSVLDPDTLMYKTPTLHPYLKEILAQRYAWEKPKPRKEPWTGSILESLVNSAPPPSHPAFLEAHAAATDWCGVTCFTGSRVAEYGQTNPPAGGGFNCVPLSEEAGEWAGMPIAFIAGDFSLWTADRIFLPHSAFFAEASLARVHTIRVRFRFDKSRHNFSTREFQRSDIPYLDMGRALQRIFLRARLLRVPITFPLGVFIHTTKPGHFKFLTGKHVQETLRLGCTLAYPDPQHYLRRNITCLVAHSNRVTAAVCLRLGGADIPTIAFKLRWSVASVETYLRDCYQLVGDALAATVRGAFSTMV
jgi:hypothetical protein